jgi:hypothetical protein
LAGDWISQAACIPGAITRDPAKAVMTKSWQGPHSGEVVAAMVGIASVAAGFRHLQIPNSRVTGSPSRKQIDPASVAGNTKIA